MAWQLLETLAKLCAASCKASGALSALSTLSALVTLAASALESALETALTVAFSAIAAVIQTHPAFTSQLADPSGLVLVCTPTPKPPHTPTSTTQT